MKTRPSSSRLAQTRAAVERHREELALLHAVSEAANESVRLRSVLAEVTEMICEHMSWPVGHALTVERGEPSRMRSLQIWHLDDPESLAPIRAHSEALGYSSVAGRLLDDPAPLVLSGIDEDGDFERREAARAAGLDHYYVLPILSGEQVVAALEFMAAEPDPRGAEHLEMLLANIGTIIGRVAEREARERERLVLIRTELAREEAEERAEQLRRLAAELSRRNHELDQFAYVASHDLRAPLRGISNLAAWIAKDLEPHLTDDTRRHLELLQGRVERMSSLINGLLEYSRVGRNAAPDEDIELEPLVRDIAEMLDPDAEVEWVFSALPTTRANRLLLRQVFENLMSNAIKYTTAEVPRVEVSARREGDAVWRYFVADNGPGIDPCYQDRIWEIFQVLQPRDDVEGTGIGLSLVRKIVEQRGGEVGVESEPGAGATFTFTWPEQPRRENSDVHDAPQQA